MLLRVYQAVAGRAIAIRVVLPGSPEEGDVWVRKPAVEDPPAWEACIMQGVSRAPSQPRDGGRAGMTCYWG